MSSRIVPGLFQIEERIAFEKWIGRYKKQVSWKGEGIVLRWESGVENYLPPGTLLMKSRRGLTAFSIPHSAQPVPPIQGCAEAPAVSSNPPPLQGETAGFSDSP